MVGQTSGRQVRCCRSSRELHQIHKHEGSEKEKMNYLGIGWDVEISQPTPSDIPPTRSHLIILPKQFHQLEVKY